MDRPDMKKVDDNTLQYIEHLESTISGVDNLSKALMYASHILATDIYKLCDGTAFVEKEGVPVNQLSILKGDPKDKTFDQLMDVFNSFGNKIMNIGGKKASIDKNSTKFKPGDNFYENTLRAVKKNGSSKI